MAFTRNEPYHSSGPHKSKKYHPPSTTTPLAFPLSTALPWQRAPSSLISVWKNMLPIFCFVIFNWSNPLSEFPSELWKSSCQRKSERKTERGVGVAVELQHLTADSSSPAKSVCRAFFFFLPSQFLTFPAIISPWARREKNNFPLAAQVLAYAARVCPHIYMLRLSSHQWKVRLSYTWMAIVCSRRV